MSDVDSSICGNFDKKDRKLTFLSIWWLIRAGLRRRVDTIINVG